MATSWVRARHASRRCARQTARILAALDNPQVRVLAHPTGRLIGVREPDDVDVAAIVRKARERGVVLELNAHPERPDLGDTHCRPCEDEDVAVAINPDAHATGDFAFLGLGIGKARRGGLTRDDVLDTRALRAVREFLGHAAPGQRRALGKRRS
jgi:DNA polymerase (family 10)